MVFECKLCEKETCYTTHLCEKCRRIKHLINLYGDRVYEVLETILVRTEDKQENKIKEEIKTELTKKEYFLRNNKNVKKDKHIKRGTESE